MTVKVLGSGCGRCTLLMQLAERALHELGLNCAVEKVTDLRQIMSFGVMMTPALVVDGEVKLAGKVPSVADLKRIFQEVA